MHCRFPDSSRYIIDYLTECFKSKFSILETIAIKGVIISSIQAKVIPITAFSNVPDSISLIIINQAKEYTDTK